MESEFTFEPNQKSKRYQKFNEDIIILNEEQSYDKKENNSEINDNPIFSLSIELEMGKSDKIDVYKNSDPYNVANNFCIEHNLGISTFQYLKEKIEYLIEEYKSNKNLDVEKCMNDINKDFNEMNNNYIIEENNENISQNFDNKSNNISNNFSNNISNNISNNFKYDNKNNKLDYFSYFLNKNKNKAIKKDCNNNTMKNNNRNNNNKNLHQRNKSCKTNVREKYKKEMKIRNDINQYLDSKEKNNKNIDQKINNYCDNYKSSIMSNITKVETKRNISLSSPKNQNPSKVKIISEKKNKEEDESFINQFFTKKELPRKKSAYFRSLLTKNESIGRNVTSDNTYSSSKINLDSFNSNRNNQRKLILSGFKFNQENPVIINNKPIKNYGQYLFEKGEIEKKEKRNEINEIQRLGDLEQFKSCSFQPKTNYKKNRNVHSKYLEKNKLILNEEKYNFKPKINNNYKTTLNFEQRQTVYKNLYKKKNEEMKKFFIDTKYDEKGNELFKPKLISRQINTEKTEKTIDIFDKNYSYYKKYEMDKNRLIKKFYNNLNYTNEKNICSRKHTNKIMNDLYCKIFKYLFNELDSDHDDLITSLTINLDNIPKYIIKILEPILKELKDDEQTLNCEEFILVMKRLFEDTPMLEKQKLINYYQNKVKSDNHNNDIFKRNKTPYYNNIIPFYKNIKTINNNNNDSRTHSSKNITINNNVEIKEEEESNEKNFDDFNIIYKESPNKNDKNEINSGFEAISKYTFNNYIKQFKS